ncbi:MAG: hypothetical protein ABR591_08745 [Candidatus Velthaea sp.]
MKSSADAAAASFAPIAEAAQAQAGRADDVSASTAELAAQMQQIDVTAAALREQAERLGSLVSTFRIDKEAAPESDAVAAPAEALEMAELQTA